MKKGECKKKKSPVRRPSLVVDLLVSPLSPPPPFSPVPSSRTRTRIPGHQNTSQGVIVDPREAPDEVRRGMKAACHCVMLLGPSGSGGGGGAKVRTFSPLSPFSRSLSLLRDRPSSSSHTHAPPSSLSQNKNLSSLPCATSRGLRIPTCGTSTRGSLPCRRCRAAGRAPLRKSGRRRSRRSRRRSLLLPGLLSLLLLSLLLLLLLLPLLLKRKKSQKRTTPTTPSRRASTRCARRSRKLSRSRRERPTRRPQRPSRSPDRPLRRWPGPEARSRGLRARPAAAR